MIKISLLIALTFAVQLHAIDNTTDLDELERLNQRVIDVFKDTEFDFDEPKLEQPKGCYATNQLTTEHSSNNQTFFKLQSPETITQTIDSFMIKELLDNCSQTLLNDIHNTSYISKHSTLRYDAIYTNQMTRLLLTGPRGSGKSSLALAIAYKLNRPYIFVSAAALANEYKNSAISIINNLFDPIIESQNSAIVIIDEITAFTKRFNAKNGDSDPGAVEHLWIKLDACKNNPGLLVIFTANSTDEIPDTIKDRLSGSEFFIDHPDFYARKRIIEHYLSPYFNFDKKFLDEIAKKTEGFTLREINMVIFRAKNNALHRNIKSDNSTAHIAIRKNDIESALKTLVAAHNTELSKKNKQYYKEIYETISPHIVPIVSMLINIYLQVKFHDQQMTFSKKCHEEITEINQWNADRQYYEMKETSKKNMEFQRGVHWDTMALAHENAEHQKEFANQTHNDTKTMTEEHHKDNTQQSLILGVGSIVAAPAAKIALAAALANPVTATAGLLSGGFYMTETGKQLSNVGVDFAHSPSARGSLAFYFKSILRSPLFGPAFNYRR